MHTIVRFTIVFLETAITCFRSYCSISKEYLHCHIKQYFDLLHVTSKVSFLYYITMNTNTSTCCSDLLVCTFHNIFVFLSVT